MKKALLLVVSLFCAAALAEEGPFYAAADFARVEKIDAHVHLTGPADQFMAQAARDNFRLLTINTDYPDFPPLKAQQDAAESLRQRYPGRIEFAGTFSVQGFGAPGWAGGAIQEIDAARAGGAIAIKIWKNIGMALQDPPGHYVLIDDPRLAPVIAHLEQQHVVLLAHQAEPLNCWLPLEQMTVRSDREYFAQHPQYYMYHHPELPGHRQILAARDRMLAAHPDLRFVGVHLASLEWDVDKVAAFLERFPQAQVDVAARTVHLEYQAVQHRQKVRAFLIRYQDRILYGSDEQYGSADTDVAGLADTHSSWQEDRRFYATDEMLHSKDFDAPFRGLQLPRTVIDKIYGANARILFPGAWRAH
ncbi:MAG: amidohydrolase family protein [Gammaproteobacteria bacterium]|nr:amidohydrolase family protein [Gammaproteobacteria bacterium]